MSQISKSNKFFQNSGQSLMEIIIGMAVATIFIGASVGAISLILRSNYDVRTTQIADSLTQEYLNALQTVSEKNWHDIYDLNGKGSSSQFYLIASGTTFAILSSATTTIMEEKSFTRYFSVENVNRDGSGNIVETGGNEDPSTQKITATIDWEGGRSLDKTQYLTRSRNLIFRQTDWSGGANQEGPIILSNNKFASSTNIDYTASSGLIKIQGF